MNVLFLSVPCAHFVFLDELLESIIVLRAHGLGQVAVACLVGEVQFVEVVLRQDEGEHGVLRKIVITAAGESVEVD